MMRVLAIALTTFAIAGDTDAAEKKWTRSSLKSLAMRIALEERLSPSLFDALITAESNYDVNALSPKGAMSLAQLMPATARELGLKAEEHFEPEANLRGGARYLRAQLDEAGDVAVALGAYNAGMDRVKGRPFEEWPGETRGFVGRILGAVDSLPARRVIGSIVSMPRAAKAGEGADDRAAAREPLAIKAQAAAVSIDAPPTDNAPPRHDDVLSPTNARGPEVVPAIDDTTPSDDRLRRESARSEVAPTDAAFVDLSTMQNLLRATP